MRIKILILLLIVSGSVYAVEYNTYDIIVEHEFSASYRGRNDTNDLNVDLELGGPGPWGPTIYFRGEKTYIADRLNNRTVITHDNYSYQSIETNSFTSNSLIVIQDNNEIGVSDYGVSIRSNGQFTGQVRSSDISFMRSVKSALYYKNYLFIHDKNNILWSIKEPSNDVNKNKSNVLNEEDTIELINSRKIKGLTIDSEKRLFVDGELRTLDYKTYIGYWASKNDLIAGNINEGIFSYERIKPMMLDYYLGSDTDGNEYWSSVRTIMVFNKTGYLIDRFRFNMQKSETTPIVSPEGDVYFMNYSKDKVTLYKIPRQW